MVDDIFSRIIPKGCDNPEAHFPNTASLPGFPGVIKLSDQLIKKVNKPTFNPLKFGADKQDPFLANIAKSQKEMMDEMSGSMDLKPPIDEDDAKKDTVQIGGCKIVSEPKPVTEHFLERDSTANKHDAFDADNGNEIASVLESVRPMDDEFKNMEEKNFVTQRPLMPYCPLKSSQRRVIIHPSLPLRTALPGSNKLSRIPQRQSKTHISRNIRKSNVVKPLSAQKMPVIANKAKISVREAATRTVPKTVAIDRPRARKTVTYATKKVLKQSYRRDSQSMLSSAGTVNVPKTKLMNASNVQIVNEHLDFNTSVPEAKASVTIMAIAFGVLAVLLTVSIDASSSASDDVGDRKIFRRVKYLMDEMDHPHFADRDKFEENILESVPELRNAELGLLDKQAIQPVFNEIHLAGRCRKGEVDEALDDAEDKMFSRLAKLFLPVLTITSNRISMGMPERGSDGRFSANTIFNVIITNNKPENTTKLDFVDSFVENGLCSKFFPKSKTGKKVEDFVDKWV
uniref:CDT1 domain-containing protein n=1 Tax=Syphacia muris TaxID=451379 RepID=A0A158R4U2_9BILA